MLSKLLPKQIRPLDARLIFWFLFAALVLVMLLPGRLLGGDIEQPPIRYSTSQPDNVIVELQRQLDTGKVKLQHDPDHGYLKSVLQALEVPVSSQVLVFSKTSLQRQRIAPKTPRAIYFNDDIYIGFCLRGDVVEVSAVDNKLGTVFYTLDQDPTDQPRFTRQTDNCLLCHGSSRTQGYPGHTIRSVYTDNEGMPLLSLGGIRVDHTTPFGDRWGGWYVTGTSGKQTHRGNQTLPPRTKEPPRDNPDGVNLTSLKDRFTIANYLTPHSDLVALLVLEHQAEVHNAITRANFETRMALHQQAEFDRILGRKTNGLSESSQARIKSACEPLVRYLLFSDEGKLFEAVSGTSRFAEEFRAKGPNDTRGRSLREFDLKTRLFRYPCSYLIYSKAFDALPIEAKAYVYRRMREVLSGQVKDPEYRHLSQADRENIREILRDTKTGLPADW